MLKFWNDDMKRRAAALLMCVALMAMTAGCDSIRRYIPGSPYIVTPNVVFYRTMEGDLVLRVARASCETFTHIDVYDGTDFDASPVVTLIPDDASSKFYDIVLSNPQGFSVKSGDLTALPQDAPIAAWVWGIQNNDGRVGSLGKGAFYTDPSAGMAQYYVEEEGQGNAPTEVPLDDVKTSSYPC